MTTSTINSDAAEAKLESETADVAMGRFRWHTSAPAKVSRAKDWGDDSPGWAKWRAYLQNRRRPAVLSTLVSGRTSPILWGLVDDGHSESPSAALAANIHRAVGKGGKIRRKLLSPARVSDWLDSSSDGAAHLGDALECLSWAHVLPSLAAIVPARTWWKLLDHLSRTAEEAEEIDAAENPLLFHLLAGELPLVLGFLLPEIEECRAVFAKGRATISKGIVELLDGEGFPEARNLDAFRALLACWTRVRLLGNQRKGFKVTKSATLQHEWAVRQMLSLMRGDRSQIFAENGATLDRDTLDAVLDVAGDADDRQIAGRMWRATRNGQPRKKLSALPDAAACSEWAGVAVLRSSWKRGEPVVGLTFDSQELGLEIESGGDTLIHGPWGVRLKRNGRVLEMGGAWEAVCWADDEDGVYLELESDWTDEVRLQRHVFLARDDRFAILADSVLNPQGGTIELTSTLRTHARSRYRAAYETREGWLETDRRRAQVLPVSLPEWRTASCLGTFDCDGGCLRLAHQGEGGGLFGAIFVDFDNRRFKRPLTWRSLTVGEERQLQPPDRAAGFRVQIGNEQWLIYRSLTRPTSRTLLGHNLISEFLCGRFGRDGLVEPLVEIE